MITNSQLPTPDSQLPTPDSQLPTPDSGLPTPNSRLPTSDSQLLTPDSRLPTSVFLDSHVHFWNYDAQNPEFDWIGEGMEAIKRSFLPEDWTPLAPEKNTNITPHSFPDSRINTPDSRLPSPDSRLKTPNSGLIAIQAAQTWQETEFLLSLAEKHSFIKGVVGWINLTNSKIEIQNSKSLKGFRHIVQSEPQGFMLQKSFLNGIEFIGKQGFTYDILIKYTQLDEAFEMVKQFPNQKFVIDHLAKPDIRNAEIEHWKNGIEKFKTLDNVYCKISGMVTEADWKNWKYLELKPYLDVVFDVFGTKRLMYGSDWPVCLLAADYSRVYDTTASFIASLSENEQEQIFSTNGIHFYNIKT